MRVKVAVFTLILLSGCVTIGQDLARLQAKKPAPGDFNQSLATEYLAYAQSLAEEGHPIRADRFAAKGLDALAGRDVPLEEKPEYTNNRLALMAVLTPDIKEIAPAKAARAQLLFDCWMEKETVCRDSFSEALSDLQFVADALVHGESNRFEVSFANTSSTLDAKAETVVDIIARRVSGYGEYRIELRLPSRHSKLNMPRVLAIEKALIARGVNAGWIMLEPRGKEVALSTDRQDANTIVMQVQSYVAPEPPAGK